MNLVVAVTYFKKTHPIKKFTIGSGSISYGLHLNQILQQVVPSTRERHCR